MQRIYLISTGGTIEKVYSEQSGVWKPRGQAGPLSAHAPPA